MNRPCVVGLEDRPSWGQVSLLVHPLGYFDVGVPFRMHLGDGIEEELLVLRIRGMPQGGGVVLHVEGYVKTFVFVYLPTKSAVRTRIVYNSGVITTCCSTGRSIRS